MSTPEQPDTPPLTRKQMRDIRNTGSTPVITDAMPDPTPAPVPARVEPSANAPVAADEAPAEEAPADEATADVAPVAAVATPAPHPSAPLPRAAVPAVVPDAPVADAAVDLGVSPLTRRQARQQERIRTASVPVITPEVAAAYAAGMAASAPVDADAQTEAPAEAPAEGETPTAVMRDLFGIEADDAEADASTVEEATPEAAVAEESHDVEHEPEVIEAVAVEESDDELAEVFGTDDDTASESDAAEPDAAAADADPVTTEAERPVLNPLFGSAISEDEATIDLPTSFDQLLGRSAGGSNGTPSALILTQSTGGSPIVAPVTATGEMLVTGTLNLPEGLGSIGHARGAADGKEVDAVLVDGELPAHSSPTPIAASAAISTVKTNGDVIKPPAPEKGSRLMMTLAITAGVLALALVGVLILAFVNGVF